MWIAVALGVVFYLLGACWLGRKMKDMAEEYEESTWPE